MLLILSTVIVVGSIFFPWWQMEFFAPQYPEGLNIIVYPNKLAGEIDIINGLNHYIGMEEFSEENFPELNYLPYLIGGLALLTLITALFRRKFMLYGIITLITIGGGLGIYTLYSSLREFGTNLNPKAPIEVEPFIPPIIGENQLANFTTHSYLGIGSYMVIVAFILILTPLWKDRKKQ